MTDEITYYLEMTSADQLKEKSCPDGFEIQEVKDKDYKFNQELYKKVGAQWGWTDRLTWSDSDWQSYVESNDLRTWAAYLESNIAGYFELDKQQDDVEIVYFGLLPDYINNGFGGYMLSHATQSAWQWLGTKRVWLHTCNFDHENALNNYCARGFSLFKTEQGERVD